MGTKGVSQQLWLSPHVTEGELGMSLELGYKGLK